MLRSIFLLRRISVPRPHARSLSSDTFKNEIEEKHSQVDPLRLYLQSKNIPKVFETFKELQKQGKLPSISAYHSFIKACVMTRDVKLAESAFEELKVRRTQLSLPVYSMMLSLYTRTSQFDKIEPLYEEMVRNGVQPNNYILNAMIRACVKKRSPDEGEVWFKKMREMKLKPDESTYIELLKIRSSNFERLSQTWNELKSSGIELTTAAYATYMFGCFELKQFSAVISSFNELKERVFSRKDRNTFVIFHLLLRTCASTKNFEMAKKALDLAEKNRIQLNPFHFSSLLTIYNQQYLQPEDVEQIIQLFQKLDPHRIDLIVYHSLLELCARFSRAELAESVFRKIEEKGLTPNAATYSFMIKAIANSNFERAFQLLTEMKSKSILPTVECYSPFFSAYVQLKKSASDSDVEFPSAELITSLIREASDLNPKSFTFYASALSALARLAKYDEAFSLLQQQRADNIPITAYELDILFWKCSLHREAVSYLPKLTEFMEELQLSPTIRTYNSLIRACMWNRNIPKALDIYETIKRKGLSPNSYTFSFLLKFVDDPTTIEYLRKEQEHFQAYSDSIPLE